MIIYPIGNKHKYDSFHFEEPGYFGNIDSKDQSDDPVVNETLVLFGDGDEIHAFTNKHSMRFLLISGQPIGEPIAWHGPVVMNTQEELHTAFEEIRLGNFIKYKG